MKCEHDDRAIACRAVGCRPGNHVVALTVDGEPLSDDLHLHVVRVMTGECAGDVVTPPAFRGITSRVRVPEAQIEEGTPAYVIMALDDDQDDNLMGGIGSPGDIVNRAVVHLVRKDGSMMWGFRTRRQALGVLAWILGVELER
jgi:hypothetical protein